MQPSPSQSLCDMPVCSEARKERERGKPSRSTQAEVRSAEKNMISGGLAGCIGKTLTAPLSRLTVLYQVGPLLEKAHLHAHDAAQSSSSASPGAAPPQRITQNTVWQTLRSVVQREGVLSLWNGNFVSVLHRFPYSAINFATYEACKQRFGSGDDAHDSSLTRFVCGGISGAVSCISCYPLDIVRTRLAVGAAALPHSASSCAPSSSSSRRTLRDRRSAQIVLQILEREGVLGLYRGLGASLMVVMPNLALSFTVYGKTKEWMVDRRGAFFDPDTQHLNYLGALLSGCLSGATSSLLLFPLDVIRKRLQVVGLMPAATVAAASQTETERGAQQTPSPRQGMLYHARMIFTHHGVRGFYRGLSTEILKVCPMVAITFSSYEMVKNQLDKRFPSDA